MAFRKYQKAEKVETVTKADSAKIAAVVKEAGVKSASELSEEEREKLRDN